MSDQTKNKTGCKPPWLRLGYNARERTPLMNTHMRDLFLERATAEPYEKLARSLIARAVRDASADQPKLAAEARAWLRGLDAISMMELLDMNPDRLNAWLDQNRKDKSTMTTSTKPQATPRQASTVGALTQREKESAAIGILRSSNNPAVIALLDQIETLLNGKSAPAKPAKAARKINVTYRPSAVSRFVNGSNAQFPLAEIAEENLRKLNGGK